MSDLVGIVQELLLKEISASEREKRLQDAVKALTDQRMRSQSTCVVRLARCLASLEKDEGLASWFDMAGHLRQVILMHHRWFTLHQDYADGLRPLADRFGLTIDHTNEVNASERFPSWMEYGEHLQSVYNLEQRNEPKRRIGDGILYNMTGYSEYASEEQKTLVQASMNMKEGETLLACLPTGGGKSLVGQMPAYFETQGGTIHGGVARGGTTVVIVPTVALALDQYRSACSFFDEALSEEHQPQAYYGGMGDHEKEVIYNGLQNGTLPILFTSPEAVLNGGLYGILMKAASHGKLNRLVIDEAHIVVDWGGAFRTDFQFLAVLQNKLLEASGHKLKTVLLSATLTDLATQTLIKLFSNGENLTEIRSDALRFEPIYFLDRSEDVRTREDKIREVLPLLPKPLILYVSRLEDASDWERIIRETGFQSVALFTGETSSNDRKAILERWNRDQLDIIVATSAFGMGVDKPDIRTVIHCCLPESVNRYYQEVGRGGRDGFASISLLCVTEKELQDKLAMNNILTVEKLVERWEKMRSTPFERTSGDTFWMDTNTRPGHLKDQETGQRNARWNEAALLFLYREGLIDILDIRKREGDVRRQIHIQMRDLENLQDTQKLAEKLEPVRQKEVHKLRYENQKMKDMVKKAKGNCFSDVFQDTYEYTNEACGGCPYCHERQAKPYANKTDTEFVHTVESIQSDLGAQVKDFLGEYPELLISVPALDVEKSENIITITNEMVDSGVQYIILPPFEGEQRVRLVCDLRETYRVPYTIYDYEELLNSSLLYQLTGPVMIYYPGDGATISRLYQWSRHYQQRNPENKVIHVAQRDVWIYVENKRLMELIDGNTMVVEQLKSPDKTEEFI